MMVVWDKGLMGMGWHYRRSYETILVATKPGQAVKWNGDARVENIIRPGQYGIRKIIPSKDQHPTQKPTELMSVFIQWHTNPGDIVADPFMGSGTTGVACAQLNRNFIGIELDKDYFEIAQKRIEDARKQLTLGI